MWDIIHRIRELDGAAEAQAWVSALASIAALITALILAALKAQPSRGASLFFVTTTAIAYARGFYRNVYQQPHTYWGVAINALVVIACLYKAQTAIAYRRRHPDWDDTDKVNRTRKKEW